MSKSLVSVVFLFGSVAVVACGDDTSSTGANPDVGCEAGTGCPAVVSECIAFADNAASTKFAVRISQLTIEAPPALTNELVVNLITKGITLNYPSCAAATGDPIFTGDGTFSWILEIDKQNGELRTGGAKLEPDPNKGYCFVNETIQSFPVAPFTVPLPVGGDGSFATMGTKAVTVPIYTDPKDASKVILLPLRGVRIFDGKLSADNNCVGTYNGANLDPVNLCKPEATVPLFNNGAKLDGYITLEDADAVVIPELDNKTLCWLIADAGNRGATNCNRDAGNLITYKGDWCAGATPDDPGSAGGCGDSVKLAASFAASAATVRSDCQ